MSKLDKVQESLFERWREVGIQLGNHGCIVQNSWEQGAIDGHGAPTDTDIEQWLASITDLGVEVKKLREETICAYQEFKHYQQQSEKE